MAEGRYSVSDFAQAIREKHPGAYDKWDDRDLAEAYVEKFPAYMDQVDLATPAPQGPSVAASAIQAVRENAVPAVQQALQSALAPAKAVVRGAKEVFGNQTPIPGMGAAADTLEQGGPQVADAVAAAAARRGLPFPAVLGAAAGTPSTLADLAIPHPRTVGEAAQQAAYIAAAEGALALGRRGPSLPEAMKAIRRRMGIPETGTIVEGSPAAAADVTPRPVVVPDAPSPRVVPVSNQGLLPALAESAAALPAPVPPPQLPHATPISGDGFLMVRPGPWRTGRQGFDPATGTNLDILSPSQEQGGAGSAIRRALGVKEPPAAKATPAPALAADPAKEAARAAKEQARALSKRAKEILKDKTALRDPALVAELGQARAAGALSDVQLKTATHYLTDRHASLLRDYGPDDILTMKARAALEAFGIRPAGAPPALPTEPSTPAPLRAAAPVAAAPAGEPPPVGQVTPRPVAPTPAPEPLRAQLEVRFGRPLYKVPLVELEAAFPPEAVPIEDYRQAMLEAVAKEQKAQKKLIPDEVFNDWMTRDPEGAARYEAWAREDEANRMAAELKASGVSNTPVLDLASKFPLSKAKNASYAGELDNLKAFRILTDKDSGVSLDHLAEMARTEGIIPEHDVNMLLQALDHEARTGKPLYPQRGSLEGQVPLVGRPGQEGSLFPKRKAPSRPTPTLDEIDAMKAPKAAPSAPLADRFRAFAERVKAAQLDYLAPLERFVADAEKKLGRKFTAEENAYVQGSLYPGISGIIEDRATTFEGIIGPVAKRGLDVDLDRYLTLRQFAKRLRDLEARAVDLASSGDPESMKEAAGILKRLADNKANPRGFNEAKVQKGLAELGGKLSPAEYAYIEQKAKEVWAFNRRLLTEARDAGLISQAAFQAIESRGLDYTPIEVLDFIMEDLAGSQDATTRKLSTAYQDVLHRMEGTERDVRGALAATFDKMVRGIASIERNKVMRRVWDLRQVPGLEKVITELAPGQKPPADMGTLYVFVGGKRVAFAAPLDIAAALGGLDSKSFGLVDRMLHAFQTPLKMGATGANIEFALPNFARDLMDFALLSETGLRARSAKEVATLPLQAARLGVDLAEAFFHVIRQDAAYREVLKSKSLYSTIQRGLNPEAILESLRPQEAGKSILRKANPLALVQRAINILEETPKVASYRRGLRMGMSPDAAALETRRRGGSPDFQRRGHSSPDVGLLVMFYNARLQGTARMVEAVHKNPAEVGLKLAALVGLPAVVLYLWNRQFADYDSLPPHEKFQNRVIMLGFNYRDRDGVVKPAYLKLPKTEVERAIVAGLDAAMDRYFDTAGHGALQSAIDAVGAFSPINFNLDLKHPGRSMATSLVSGLNPILKASAEIMVPGGYDTFRDRPVENASMQSREPYARFRPDTSETSKAVGRALARPAYPGGPLRGGASPAMLDHAVESIAAGVGRQALDVSDAVLRARGLAPEKRYGSTYERVSEVPVLRRFVGRLEPRTDVADQVYAMKTQRERDKATAKWGMAQAILGYATEPSKSNLEAMQQAAIEAARISPDIPRQAFRSALRELAKKDVPRALDVFQSMSRGDQMAVMQEMGRSADGQALRGRLFNEFRKRRTGL